MPRAWKLYLAGGPDGGDQQHWDVEAVHELLRSAAPARFCRRHLPQLQVFAPWLQSLLQHWNEKEHVPPAATHLPPDEPDDPDEPLEPLVEPLDELDDDDDDDDELLDEAHGSA